MVTYPAPPPGPLHSRAARREEGGRGAGPAAVSEAPGADPVPVQQRRPRLSLCPPGTMKKGSGHIHRHAPALIMVSASSALLPPRVRAWASCGVRSDSNALHPPKYSLCLFPPALLLGVSLESCLVSQGRQCSDCGPNPSVGMSLVEVDSGELSSCGSHPSWVFKAFGNPACILCAVAVPRAKKIPPAPFVSFRLFLGHLEEQVSEEPNGEHAGLNLLTCFLFLQKTGLHPRS